MKKVNASTRSGAATDDIYEPTLWYFHLLDFLSDQETPRETVSNFDDLTQVIQHPNLFLNKVQRI